MLTKRECAWLRLHLIPGLGRRGLFQLLSVFPSPEEAIDAGVSHWPERIGSVNKDNLRWLGTGDCSQFDSAVAALEDNDARIISFWDDDYPALLKTIHDPPALLYVIGHLSEKTALAVVGSRRCTSAGKQTTSRFSRELADRGIVIVSGLARGIDSAAHAGALEAGGETIAVLGCGVDRIYPSENRGLYRRIAEAGAIISEYLPGTEPLPGHFPGRNRIISGLSQGVLVVEAARGSGSLITAEFSLEQGREVFAVPGPITAPGSSGVNALLKDGARLVTEPQDILNVLKPGVRTIRPATFTDCLDGLSEEQKSLVEQLSEQPVQVDDLARKSGLTPMELSAILLQLELRGAVLQLPGMRYIRSF